jgi:hypothetical protein
MTREKCEMRSSCFHLEMYPNARLAAFCTPIVFGFSPIRGKAAQWRCGETSALAIPFSPLPNHFRAMVRTSSMSSLATPIRE